MSEENKPDIAAAVAAIEAGQPTGNEGLQAKLDAQNQELGAMREQVFAASTAGIDASLEVLQGLRVLQQHAPELYASQLAALTEANAAKHSPPAARGDAKFEGIGAPRGHEAFEQGDPNKWNSDTVARYRADGTFLNRIEDYKATLPGGSGGLFKNRADGTRKSSASKGAKGYRNK